MNHHFNRETTQQSYLSEQQPQETSLNGLQAIITLKSFSSKASSLYLSNIRSYIVRQKDESIMKMLEVNDANLFYSLNASSLWLLLKNKLKKISHLNIFKESNDKIIIKYSLIVGSILALNDGKEKIIDKNRQLLRKSLKADISSKIKLQQKRSTSIQPEFQDSFFMKSYITQKMNLQKKQLESLIENIISINLKHQKSIKKYLEGLLSYIQRKIKAIDKQIQQAYNNHNEHLQINPINKKIKNQSIRQAYSIALLCNYLKVHLVYPDWISLMLKDKDDVINGLFFVNMKESKGFRIINRIVDDAHVNNIISEISNLQKIFSK